MYCKEKVRKREGLLRRWPQKHMDCDQESRGGGGKPDLHGARLSLPSLPLISSHLCRQQLWRGQGFSLQVLMGSRGQAWLGSVCSSIIPAVSTLLP